jgi:hypothetical protein
LLDQQGHGEGMGYGGEVQREHAQESDHSLGPETQHAREATAKTACVEKSL